MRPQAASGDCEPRLVEDVAGIASPSRRLHGGAAAEQFDLRGEERVGDLALREAAGKPGRPDFDGAEELVAGRERAEFVEPVAEVHAEFLDARGAPCHRPGRFRSAKECGSAGAHTEFF